ncbi:MAG: hypothetical protein HXY41_16940 [Chloroflexi bacterium]|nr:hypothetical protein [Chloroflexota bacterium]
MTQSVPARRFSLSEDWLATLIGLLIVAIIGLGLIGPGPQSVTLKAKPGESVDKTARSLDGWKVSATVGGEKAAVEGAPTQLLDAQVYPFVCEGGQMIAEAVDSSLSLPPGGTYLTLTNNCDAEVSLTYTTDYAIRWPLFGIFKR